MATRIIRRWSFYRDTLPVMVLIGIECSDTGLYTLFKAATNTGMSDHVFVAYAYALATTLLFPSLFFSKGSRVVPPLSFSVLIKIILLGIIGSSSQVLGYAGIRYSSPTLSSSIGNLVPAFTFLLAIIFRMEKVAAKSRSSQAKGIFGKLMSNAVYAWALHLKGAVYVTSFKPLTIVIAIAMGVMFLGDTLHIGSIIGATIISIGLYTVLWGKSKEAEEDVVGSLESVTSDENVPLLHSYNTPYYCGNKRDTNV
ncbi:hypothetical protein PIB30_058280 [Stylosanthes scabra]|uniref:WAT1-related protein n=1 Tax=Stylosanthes scabra TaxID=79078 RepID=A0ABU6VIX5_9FABA|nr:hypothetical protein [Stylosanthes scabra]